MVAISTYRFVDGKIEDDWGVEGDHGTRTAKVAETTKTRKAPGREINAADPKKP